MVLSLRGPSEHETFDHPVAVFIVISASDPDPMTTITQLYNPNIPSFTVDKPFIDPNVLRYYVILHDRQRATDEQAQATFEKLRRTLGLHCQLLRINSRPGPPPNTDLLDLDASESPAADPGVSDVWNDTLSEAYAVENRLQAYTADLIAQQASADVSGSGSSSNLGHTRSSSVASNQSSASSFPSTPNQSSMVPTPLEMSNASLDSSSYFDPQQQQQAAQQRQISTAASHTIIDDQTMPTVNYGSRMTLEDVDRIKTMVREFAIQSLIPFMERNIQNWNEQVASARRGLTGRLFGAGRRFFGSSSRSSSTHSMQLIPTTGLNVPAGVNQITIYPHSAPEAQMRKLADYAFMIRDYKFAQAIYDTVRRDYATDKAYKYHAGSLEMIGICTLMMNQSLRNKADVDRNFELAVQLYLGRCRSPYQATRTTLIYYELLKAHRMWKDVPTALVRMTGEDSDLRSALFLEQAAHCFLRAPRAMVRKYGFHAVMAAHRYAKANQRQHAFRCYQMALHVFQDQVWSVAQSHIQFALGRQSFHLGRMEEAVTFFCNVLADSKQTAQQQAAHVREFLFIYRQYASQTGFDPRVESLPRFALPSIDAKSVRVSISNAQSHTHSQEEWATMERELLEENIATGYIYGSKKALALQQQDDNRVVCAIGEPATVHIDLYNPLQVPLQLEDIILGCEHRDSMKPSKDKRDAEAEAYESMITGTPIEDSNNMWSFDHFELEKLNEYTLEPLEHKTINLAIIPKKEGSILVKGLHYTLNGTVHIFRPIIKQGKRLNKTAEQMRSVIYAQDHSLDMLVTSPMPLLDLTFHGVPETILSGEVVQTVLEVNNKGNKGMTALRLKTSHATFVCIGNPEDMDKPIYADTNGDNEVYALENRLHDPSVVSIPLPATEGMPGGVLSPGKTTLVPLWIRGDRIGKHHLKFLFSYQSEEDNAAIADRTLRYSLNVQVLPSLKINAFTRPSAAAKRNEYILGIEVENLQTAAGFQLEQLATTSAMWKLVPLSIAMDSPEDVAAKTAVPPRQTAFAYYKVCKAVEGMPETESPLDLQVSKVIFTFALSSRIQWRQGSLQAHPSDIENPPLYLPGDMDLTLYWAVPNMSRRGHHYIIGINLADMKGDISPRARPHSMLSSTPVVEPSRV
ncbi:ER-golgi trafficking TRAPP I complex 85 kDa subunit-domain-containing protein [Syncephalastrum racemosum]|uniref:ER-golgi trafficking TRAPP I complex 85 kDa subunit-domain-containing protein n=1 Tax=Syncephalastrum racemosum TaxID=13706 RepID=A0A1X2HN61_SYNRA|nr:ER-golgi trafficking TRAPP I complex 85 kDa subunit-domain-containing protein [Syncephalastrum racemosum]